MLSKIHPSAFFKEKINLSFNLGLKSLSRNAQKQALKSSSAFSP
jgi:hypothetical protein